MQKFLPFKNQWKEKIISVYVHKCILYIIWNGFDCKPVSKVFF